MPFSFSIANPHLSANTADYDGVHAVFNAWANDDPAASPYPEPEPGDRIITLENAATYTCPAPPGSGFTDAHCPIGIGDHDADVLMGRTLSLRQFYRTYQVNPGPGVPPQHPLGYYLDSGVIDLVTVRFESDMAGRPGGSGCTTSLTGAPACVFAPLGELLPKFEVTTSGFTSWEVELDPTDAGNGWLRRTDAEAFWPYTDSANGPYFFRPEEIADLYVGVESAGGAWTLNLDWHITVNGYGWAPGFGPPSPPPRLMMVI